MIMITEQIKSSRIVNSSVDSYSHSNTAGHRHGAPAERHWSSVNPTENEIRMMKMYNLYFGPFGGGDKYGYHY